MPRFRGGIDLVSVTATVTGGDGRFVADLRQEDFSVYEDGKRQTLTQFTRERVPVSLGILLDASGSMNAEKLRAAKAAISHLVFNLLEKDDELFFIEFGFNARLTQGWTTDRKLIRYALEDVSHPAGDTALYDAIALALPTAQEGRHVKKALLVISDGNDADSEMSIAELRQQIRESEVLVYALGVDGTSRGSSRRTGGTVSPPPVQLPIPFPFPFPGGKRPAFPQVTGGIFGGRVTNAERVNEDALRQMTDDTGGRTEIVRGFDSLDAATARIADELSKQYYLGYANNGDKDGRWHTIRVELRDRRLNVRARRGYVAS